MKTEIKEKWLTALRSGEYEQTTGTLENDGQFCCLGVLCKIAADEGVVERRVIPDSVSDDMCVAYSYRDEDDYPINNSADLPGPVVDWAGLEDEDPLVPYGDSETVRLTYLNDCAKKSFNEIADLIEENL